MKIIVRIEVGAAPPWRCVGPNRGAVATGVALIRYRCCAHVEWFGDDARPLIPSVLVRRDEDMMPNGSIDAGSITLNVGVDHDLGVDLFNGLTVDDDSGVSGFRSD